MTGNIQDTADLVFHSNMQLATGSASGGLLRKKDIVSHGS